MWRRSALSWCVVACLLSAEASSEAAEIVVGIDIEADLLTDTTHVGADGVLSLLGTTWNSAESGVDGFDLADENGVPTVADVIWISGAGAGTDPNATNDLQDSGAWVGFEVRDLAPGGSYDVAVYAMPGLLLELTDSTGSAFVFCNNSATITYALPGAVGGDYCLFSNRLPADLGGGEVGFRFVPLDGLITAVQLRTPEGPVEPAVPVLSPVLAIVLSGALSLAGVRQLRG